MSTDSLIDYFNYSVLTIILIWILSNMNKIKRFLQHKPLDS